MKKRFLAMFLALALCMGLTVPAFAAEPDFVIENGVLTKYNGPGGNVTIPNGVTEIGAKAFEFCRSMTSVTIPNGVTKIGDDAFSNCASLTSITIPNSVTEIGECAFMGCRSMASVTIPNSVTKIRTNTFCACDSLTSVTIPSSVTEIEFFAFQSCTGLTSVTILSNVAEIGGHAFYGCPNLISVTIPNGVTEIGENAFIGTPWLKGLGDFAIVNNILLAYQGNKNIVTIPNGVTRIGEGAFQSYTNLTSVTIPHGVTKIGKSAFTGCTGLTSVTIPSGVTEIGTDAFWGCTALANVTIPGSVTKIGGGAFFETPWLKSLGDFAIVNNILMKYQGSDDVVTVPNGVTKIGGSAFRYDHHNLTSVTIPNSVTEIGKNAFRFCSGLTSMTIPSSVTEIGENAFDDCPRLTSVTIPNSVTKIGADAFTGGNVTIYGQKGSCAERYAKEKGILFIIGTPMFTDLPRWCAKEAQWAAVQGIAKGTGNGKFSHNVNCTHQQILTFLWRAEDKPSSSAKAPVTVAADYADAVNWAYEKGMIDGSFVPTALCTRADAVMYIWQALGTPTAGTGSGFPDVPADADYASAVAWAVKNEVTTGYVNRDGIFSFRPDNVCTRGEIACFLYRAYVPEIPA